MKRARESSLEHSLLVLAHAARDQDVCDVETGDTDDDVENTLESVVAESGVVDGVNQVVGGQTNPTPIERADDEQNDRNDQNDRGPVNLLLLSLHVLSTAI